MPFLRTRILIMVAVIASTCLPSPSLAAGTAKPLDPDGPQVLGTALFDRACLLYARGEAEKDATATRIARVLFGRAIPYFEKARVEEPADKELINDLAAAYAATGKVERAIALLKVGIERHPKDATLAFNYGMMLLADDRMRAAKEFLVALRKLDAARAEMFERAIAAHASK